MGHVGLSRSLREQKWSWPWSCLLSPTKIASSLFPPRRPDTARPSNVDHVFPFIRFMNHHHGRFFHRWFFFPQKGNPPAYKRRTLLSLILEGTPHGYLGGNPPHDRKPRGQNLPKPRGNLPPRIYLESTPDTNLEDTPPYENVHGQEHGLIDGNNSLNGKSSQGITTATKLLRKEHYQHMGQSPLQEAPRPPRRLDISKRGFLVDRKLFRTFPQALESHTT